MTGEKKWLGPLPTNCDICRELLSEQQGVPQFVNPAFIDGKTKQGPWAIMCSACHADHGVGLGMGKGQMYRLNDGVKVEG